MILQSLTKGFRLGWFLLLLLVPACDDSPTQTTAQDVLDIGVGDSSDASAAPDLADAPSNVDGEPDLVIDALDLEPADADVHELDVAEGDGDSDLEAQTADTDGGDSDLDAVDNDSSAASPIVVQTELTSEHHFVLRTNLPAHVTDCDASALEGLDCADLDADGLVDQWEDALLDRLRPLQRFDEVEPLIDDSTAVLADVGRVFVASEVPFVVRAFIMLGYSQDYGSECLGVSGHNGDSERVAAELTALDGEAGAFEVSRWYTAAHEGTVNDHSQVFAGSSTELEFVDELHGALPEPRWVVFPSERKHGTYANVAICEAVAPFVPCVDEDCAPDNVAAPSLFDRLPAIANAGEQAAPRLDDLSSLGFSGDYAWVDQPFCGGLARGMCSSSVLEKLTLDPFP